MVLLWTPTQACAQTLSDYILTKAPCRLSFDDLILPFARPLHHKVTRCLTHHCVSSLHGLIRDRKYNCYLDSNLVLVLSICTSHSTDNSYIRSSFALFAASHLQGSRIEVFYWRSYSGFTIAHGLRMTRKKHNIPDIKRSGVLSIKIIFILFLELI